MNLVGWLVLAGCSRGDAFPKDFQWGTATAGFQVEPGCPTLSEAECVDSGSDWYQWVTDPALIAEDGLYITGDPLMDGPGMWETWESDAARMESDGLTALRMGIEWSRIFPDGAAETVTTVDELAALADPVAVARYHEMLASLDDHNIHPLVTVNHYTLPLWVHDGKACHESPDTCTADGWVTHDRIVPLISLYASYVGREFGSEVDQWATLNEPLAVVLSGYVAPGKDRSNPPGLSLDYQRAKSVLHNQILGHGAMYEALKAEDTVDADGDGVAADVGLVMNVTDIVPFAPEEPDDQEAVAHIDHLYHRMFLDGVTTGAWDEDVDGEFETTKPELVGHLDWIGLNYYTVVTVRGLPVSLSPDFPVANFYPEISWIPTPEGFDHVLTAMSRYNLPLYVTENGLSDPDPAYRSEILTGTLRVAQAQIDAGLDLRGYYYWSYVDNYEWNHGMSNYEFGLYGLDGAAKTRVERPVMATYREIIGDRGLRR